MIEEYYKILDVDKNATLSDLKKAYRKRAKLLHPDKNKSPNAQEKFILLNEAYEYLQNVKTGRIYDRKSQTYTKTTTSRKSYDQWEEAERDNARARAQQHAHMQYEEFINTKYYKTTVIINLIAKIIYFLSVIFIFIVGPVLGYILRGKTGLSIGIIVIFVTTHYWAPVLIQLFRYVRRR